jgi:hypothetical protein
VFKGFCDGHFTGPLLDVLRGRCWGVLGCFHCNMLRCRSSFVFSNRRLRCWGRFMLSNWWFGCRGRFVLGNRGLRCRSS